jgi:nicotinamidase-related amidase
VTVATIVVDMQVDFFANGHLRAIRPKLATNTNALAALAREYGSTVIWVKQVFTADLHDAFLEIRKSGHGIVIEGTPGADLLPELVVYPSDAVIVKKRYSAFFGTDLDGILNRRACKTLIIAGVNTHACVRTTVIDAYQRDYDVWLASECIDSYDEEHHAISMRYMGGKMGIAMTNEQIDAQLRKSS